MSFIILHVYRPLPPGYIVQDLLPEHAEFMAKHWKTATFDHPVELKTNYLKELISRYDTVGAFTIDNPSQPVSWTFRKTGIAIHTPNEC